MTNTKVLEKLFEARDVIHFLHLNTRTYEVHVALNSFYKEWTDLMDLFLETYQGKYGRINGEINITASTTIDVMSYFSGLMSFLNNDIMTLLGSPDSDLDNIVADMKGLVNHTLYFLSLK